VPERLIDVPIESLPFVDEHSVEVGASPEATWEALLAVVEGLAGNLVGKQLVRGLRCQPSERKGEMGTIGSTVRGFIITRAVPPAVLALMGEHRFSRYALIFRIVEREGGGPLRLSAETRAEFPQRSGRAYRTLVIGSHAHVVATARILRAVRRRAER
jgi:hypothetical protein